MSEEIVKKRIVKPQKVMKQKKPKKSFFGDKKSRWWKLLLVLLPFIAGIVFFGLIVFREAKGIIDTLANNTTETKTDYSIASMNYALRDTATEYQQEIFSELKNLVESHPNYEEVDIEAVSLVAKNYIADFYTFTNKQGQYDVGGMHYVYSHSDEKENIYLKARDGFYKYLSTYATKYGAKNLIEVENVEVLSCTRLPEAHIINEHISYVYDEETDDWVDYREDVEYGAYNVSCSWTYNEGYQPSTTKFPTSINLLIIDRGGRYEIVKASEGSLQ